MMDDRQGIAGRLSGVVEVDEAFVGGKPKFRDGIKNKRDPGKRIDLNLYAEGHKVRGLRKLPLNLLDAVRLTDKDKNLRNGFGDSFIDSYVRLKNRQWDDYAGSLSQWERDNTLDC